MSNRCKRNKVELYHVPEEGESVFWELPRGNRLLFLLGTHGKQMTWRKDRAIEVILAIGGRKEWLLLVTIRTMLFPSFLVRDSYGLVLNEEVKFTPHLSVGDFFHKMTKWKVVSAEIPLHFILCLDSQFIPRNILTSFSSLLRIPFSSRQKRKKAEVGDPCLALLGNLFFFWSPVQREQNQKKKT